MSFYICLCEELRGADASVVVGVNQVAPDTLVIAPGVCEPITFCIEDGRLLLVHRSSPTELAVLGEELDEDE